MKVGTEDRRVLRNVEALGYSHLRELLIADRYNTSGAVAALVVVMIFTTASTAMVLLITLVTAMCLVRQLGLRSLRKRRTDTAVVWFAAGSWGVSLGAVFIIPIALPIVVITLVIPVILSAMYQRDKQVRWATAGLLLVTIATGAVAQWTDGAGLEDGVQPDLASVILVGFLAMQNLPLVIAVRQASSQFRTSLDAALLAHHASQRAEALAVQSRARLAQATDSERRKIERDLHDGAQQLFVSALVRLRVFDETVKRGREPAPDMVNAIANDLEEAIDELRRLARGIYPSLLQTKGLFEALNGLARNSSAPTKVVGEDPGRMAHEVETALYFFTSEALQNVAKHAGPGAQAKVAIDLRGQDVSVQVRDDGMGFGESSATGTSRGLLNMQDRVAAVGGTVSVSSEPGDGCTVTAVVPLLGRDAIPAMMGAHPEGVSSHG